MGTTLTGTTPQDTYDSLIKVTDNGPLSGTLKKLTDGLGNDSSLSLSTTAASLSGTLAVTGASTFSSALIAATESEFTGTATNSRILVTAAGVANTILGFNNSGSTANGVVNNAGFIGVIQSYPFVFTTADTERMRITSTGNVGIGTDAPNLSGGASGSSILTISASASARNGILELNGTRTTLNDYVAYVRMFNNGAATPIADIAAIRGSSDTTGSLTLSTSNAERIRIDATGLVGIGTPTPTATLDARIAGTTSGAVIKVGNVGTGDFGGLAVSDGGAYPVQLYGSSLAFLTGNSAYASATEKVRITSTGVLELTQGQIKFPATQVPSADANTLDDYEEGTWTMGVSFGGASVGVTTSANTGTYTKIGRQVTVNGFLQLTNKGSSTGNALITGMPFTAGNTNSNYAAASIHFYSISFANQMFARVNKNSTDILLAESTEAGVWSEITDTNFANDSEVMVLATYFV
jgi:hypothetical protein